MVENHQPQLNYIGYRSFCWIPKFLVPKKMPKTGENDQFLDFWAMAITKFNKMVKTYQAQINYISYISFCQIPKFLVPKNWQKQAKMAYFWDFGAMEVTKRVKMVKTYQAQMNYISYRSFCQIPKFLVPKNWQKQAKMAYFWNFVAMAVNQRNKMVKRTFKILRTKKTKKRPILNSY